MNLSRFYFTMTLILVTVLLTSYASAIQQLDNEGPIYGECKYYTETVLENGVEVSKKETRVCDETREIGENPVSYTHIKDQRENLFLLLKSEFKLLEITKSF